MNNTRWPLIIGVGLLGAAIVIVLFFILVTFMDSNSAQVISLAAGLGFSVAFLAGKLKK